MSYLSESELNTVALLSNVPPLSLSRTCPPPAMFFWSSRDLSMAWPRQHHKQLADDDELWRRLYGVKWASRRKQRSSYPTDETSWKNYFVERQKVERHWKTGEYAIKTLQGHSGTLLLLLLRRCSPVWPHDSTGLCLLNRPPDRRRSRSVLVVRQPQHHHRQRAQGDPSVGSQDPTMQTHPLRFAFLSVFSFSFIQGLLMLAHDREPILTFRCAGTPQGIPTRCTASSTTTKR